MKTYATIDLKCCGNCTFDKYSENKEEYCSVNRVFKNNSHNVCYKWSYDGIHIQERKKDIKYK